MRVDFPAGSIFYRPGEGPRVLIVSTGLVRLYFQDLDGRQATVLFAHEGSLVGAVNVLGQVPKLFAQAVIATTVTTLDPRGFEQLLEEDLATCRALGTYVAWRLRRALELVGLRTLGTIRERLAYDLLDRACRAQLDSGHLEVAASQAELAESIGTTREVASRALAVLRAQGLVTTTRGMVRIADPTSLGNIVRDYSV
jgi:CRP-like cAMP-binding protein